MAAENESTYPIGGLPQNKGAEVPARNVKRSLHNFDHCYQHPRLFWSFLTAS